MLARPHLSSLERLRAIVRDARESNGGDVRSFAAAVNAYWKSVVTSKDVLNRFERLGLEGGNKRVDKGLLVLLAPFTPYTCRELFAIADGYLESELQPDILVGDGLSRSKTVVKPEKYKTVVAGLVAHILEIQQLSPLEFAEQFGVSVERVDAILKSAQPTNTEYEAIARALNQLRPGDWSADILREYWREPANGGS